MDIGGIQLSTSCQSVTRATEHAGGFISIIAQSIEHKSMVQETKFPGHRSGTYLGKPINLIVRVSANDSGAFTRSQSQETYAAFSLFYTLAAFPVISSSVSGNITFGASSRLPESFNVSLKLFLLQSIGVGHSLGGELQQADGEIWIIVTT